MRILVTGAFGWTARAILEGLKAAGHRITALDVLPEAEGEAIRHLADDLICANVAEFDGVSQAMQGIQVVVHLAVAVGQTDYWASEVPFATNVKGTYHILEAARLYQVDKVILMSEASVQIPTAPGEIVRATDPLKTSNNDPVEHLYDLTKRLQENIGQDFASAYGMNVVVLRAGHIVDGREQVDPHGKPLADLTYLRGGWVCRYDLATAVEQAINLPTAGYQAFHVVGSEEARATFEIERTERELGMQFTRRFTEYPA